MFPAISPELHISLKKSTHFSDKVFFRNRAAVKGGTRRKKKRLWEIRKRDRGGIKMFIKGEEGKKGKKKIVIIAVLIAAAAGTAAGMAVYHKNKGHQEENTQEAYETTVSLGMISNTITGTGNLELDDAEAVAVPSGITIKEVFAESGDYVSAGTVLAEVEESSVLTAVEDLQEELDELDQKISQCQEQEDENTVASSVSGRVKAIYVETGSDVTEVMLEQGSLMILSLDGLLAADIEGEAPGEVNEQTEVLLQDGTAVTGTIEAVNDEGYVITVSDETASAGDTVTVSETAGQGELYIHRPLEITGTVGNVEEIYVSLNEEVASGDALLSLSGSESDGEYEELLALRKAIREAEPLRLFRHLPPGRQVFSRFLLTTEPPELKISVLHLKQEVSGVLRTARRKHRKSSSLCFQLQGQGSPEVLSLCCRRPRPEEFLFFRSPRQTEPTLV